MSFKLKKVPEMVKWLEEEGYSESTQKVFEGKCLIIQLHYGYYTHIEWINFSIR